MIPYYIIVPLLLSATGQAKTCVHSFRPLVRPNADLNMKDACMIMVHSHRFKEDQSYHAVLTHITCFGDDKVQVLHLVHSVKKITKETTKALRLNFRRSSGDGKLTKVT